MYCDFFGLTAPPFNNTPDPTFFFNTPEHEEALASLLYAVQHRKGFVMVTGEVGSGKTLLSRVLLKALDPTVRTAVVTNSRLSELELLAHICRELELPVEPEPSKGRLLERLNQFLLECYAGDQPVVLVLDEAQALPDGLFEELRMMGNLEADDAKLLQVIILGQPELRARLAQPQLRQLRQRLFRAFHLAALNGDETAEYIRHRVHVAGGQADLFTPEAVATTYRSSAGLPRVINQICDNALLTAYSRSQHQVTNDILATVLQEILPTHTIGTSTPVNTAPVQAPEPEPAAASVDTHATVDDMQPEPEATAEINVPDPATNLPDQVDQIAEELAVETDSIQPVPQPELEPEPAVVQTSVQHENNEAAVLAVMEAQRSLEYRVDEIAELVRRTFEGVHGVTSVSPQLKELQRNVAALSLRLDQADEHVRRQDSTIAEQNERVDDQATLVGQRLADLDRQMTDRLRSIEGKLPLTDQDKLGKLRASVQQMIGEMSAMESKGSLLKTELVQATSQASARIAHMSEQSQRAERISSLTARIAKISARRIEQLHELLTRATLVQNQVPDDVRRAEQTTIRTRDAIAQLSQASDAAAQQLQSANKQLDTIQATLGTAEAVADTLWERTDSGRSIQAEDRPDIQDTPADTAAMPKPDLDHATEDASVDEELTHNRSGWPVSKLFQRLRR